MPYPSKKQILINKSKIRRKNMNIQIDVTDTVTVVWSLKDLRRNVFC